MTRRNQRSHLFMLTRWVTGRGLSVFASSHLFFHSLSETCSNQNPKEAWILKPHDGILQSQCNHMARSLDTSFSSRCCCLPLTSANSKACWVIFFPHLLFFVWNSVCMFKDNIKWRKICHQLAHVHCRSHAGTQSSSATQLCDLMKYLAGARGWPFHLRLTPLLRELPPARNQATAPLMRSEVRPPSVSRARGMWWMPVCEHITDFFCFVDWRTLRLRKTSPVLVLVRTQLLHSSVRFHRIKGWYFRFIHVFDRVSFLIFDFDVKADGSGHFRSWTTSPALSSFL